MSNSSGFILAANTFLRSVSSQAKTSLSENRKRPASVACRLLNVFVILVAFGFVSVSAQNVQHSKNSEDLGLRHNFTVDPVSLSLNLQITLANYNGRGGSTLPVVMRYSSKVWRLDYFDFKPPCQPPPGACDDITYTMLNAMYGDPDYERISPGWSSTLELPTVISNSEWFVGTGEPCDYEKCGETGTDRNYIRRLRLRMPDGSTHEMRADDNIYYYTQQPTYPITYNAVDGSHLRYVATGDSSAQATIYLPDGSRYITENNGWGNGQFVDRHGNTLTYTSSNNTWIDSLGRSITLGSLPGFNNSTVNFSYTYRQLKVTGDPEQSALTDFDQALAYRGPGGWWGAPETYPALFNSFSGSDKIGSGDLFNPSVLYEIQAPGGRKYTFTYNIYGEIDKVVYPTGGYERFEYAPVPGITALNQPYALTNRGVVRRWVSPDGTPGSEQEWQYGAEEISQTVLRTFVVAPNGTVTERYVHRGRLPSQKPFDFDDAKSGMVFEECTYQQGASHGQKGAMLRRTLTEWSMSQYVKQGGGIPGGFVVSRDPRVTKQVEIVLDTGGDALAGTTTYQHDTDLNVISASQYDYATVPSATAQTGAISVMPQGDLLRTSETTFLVNDPAIDSTTRDAYRARSLLSLPTSTRIKNGQGTIVAEGEVHYDEGSYPLLTYGAVTGWSDPGTNVRGLATTSRNKLIANNTWIESHIQYDQCGSPRKAWDALGNLSETEYASTNHYAYPTRMISADPDAAGPLVSLITTTAYDFASGLVLSTTDANNQTTTMEYAEFDVLGNANPLQRLTKINRPDGGWTSFGYSDAPGAASVVTRTALDASRYTEATQHFDGLGRPWRSVLSEGVTSIYADTQFDNMGRAWKQSNPYRGGEAVLWTTSGFDALGRGTSLTSPDNAVVNTSYSGNTVTVTDQAGKARKSVTDGAGRLKEVYEDPSGLNYVTNYSYDALDNLITVNQGSQTRTFVYDSLKRLTSATNPEGGTISYQYDGNGNLTQKTDSRVPAVTTTFVYDALNRVTNRSYSDGTPGVAYSYDAAGVTNSKGRLTSVSSSVSSYSYTSYDAMGRVLGSMQTTDGQAYPMSYSYDLAGNMISQTYPSGRVAASEYDAAGRLAGVKNQSSGLYYAGAAATDATNRLQYTAHGATSQMRLGNGLWEHTNFNSRLQPTQIGLGTASTNSSVLQLDYGYGTTSNNGNVLSQTISILGLTLSQTYSYDQLNRLEIANEGGGASWKQRFLYDRYGNRRIDADPANTSPGLVGPNPVLSEINNRIVAQAGEQYLYDAAGNLTRDREGQTFAFDGENKMTSFNGGASQGGADYSYDGDGRRVKKVAGGPTIVSTVFVYNVAGQLVAEYSDASSTGPGGTSYLTSDTLGTPRVITGTNQGVKARHDYLPFGEELLASTGGRTTAQGYVEDNLRQKYTSKERDVETGLDYFGERYYSSTVGRFTTVDPLGASARLSNPQSMNRYVFVLNNPLRYVDPDGLKDQSAWDQLEDYQKRTLAPKLTQVTDPSKLTTKELTAAGNRFNELAEVRNGDGSLNMQATAENVVTAQNFVQDFIFEGHSPQESSVYQQIDQIKAIGPSTLEVTVHDKGKFLGALSNEGYEVNHSIKEGIANIYARVSRGSVDHPFDSARAYTWNDSNPQLHYGNDRADNPAYGPNYFFAHWDRTSSNCARCGPIGQAAGGLGHGAPASPGQVREYYKNYGKAPTP